jgi:hypothetical protein
MLTLSSIAGTAVSIGANVAFAAFGAPAFAVMGASLLFSGIGAMFGQGQRAKSGGYTFAELHARARRTHFTDAELLAGVTSIFHVVRGHSQSIEKGSPREKYLLELLQAMRELSGQGGVKPNVRQLNEVDNRVELIKRLEKASQEYERGGAWGSFDFNAPSFNLLANVANIAARIMIGV